MEHLKPSSSQVQYNPGRKLLISFVPESPGNFIGLNQSTTKDWVTWFVDLLKAHGLPTVVCRQAGNHVDADERDNCTDFLVVCTGDYVNSPPPELDKKITEIQQLGEHFKTLMWLAEYDSGVYEDSRRFEKNKYWHVLKGKGDDGKRFRMPEETCYKDDLNHAAEIIRNHPHCEKESLICPKYQSSKLPDEHNKTAKSPSFLKRVFGWRSSN